MRALVFIIVFVLMPCARAVAQSCSISTASGSFGTINVLSGGAVDSSAAFSVTCSGTKNQTVRLCIEFGPGSSPTNGGQRALSNGTNFLNFEFYSDSGYHTVWGSWGEANVPYNIGGVQSSVNLGSSGSATQNFTAYAGTLAGQAAATPTTYSWAGLSPGLAYGYTSSSCPLSGYATATSGGTAWTATVAPNCNVSSTNINFGSSGSSIVSNVAASGTIAVQCTTTTPYSIGLGNGNHATGGGQRQMQAGAGQYLSYGLYLDAAYSQPWSSTTSPTSCSSGSGTCYLGTGTGSNQNVTVYGLVPPQTAVAAGNFTDTVVVTVTY